MRVEEYERHFMKMKQVKASEHKSLRHLINHAIAVEDEMRSHEERMRGKKMLGDRDHHDRSFQKPRSGQSNMLRGSYHPGNNQPRRSFGGGGRSLFPGGRNPCYSQRTGGYARAPPSTAKPTAGGFTVTCFACGKPGHKSYDYPDKKAAVTPMRAPAPGGQPPQAAPPPPSAWEAEPPHRGGGC
jgi:hypothetical protein